MRLPAGTEIVPLDQVLRLERRVVEKVPEESYVEIGVRSHGKGIFHKAPRSGAEIGDKDIYEIQTGDFIMQIVFAWEGAVAVAGEKDNGKCGSHRFLTFRPDPQRCDAHYLNWWCRTPDALRQILRISPGGAGRNRTLGVKRLGDVKAPLPPLPEQKRIVAWLDGLAARAAAARVELNSALAEAEEFLSATRRELIGDRVGDDWVPLSHYVRYLENGWSPKCEKRPAEQEEWGVLKLSAVTSGNFISTENKALPGDLTPDLALEVKAGDVLICRANGSAELVGSCAIAEAPSPRLLLCDKLFRVRWGTHTCSPRFLVHALRTPVVRDQIEAAAGGSPGSQKNISKPAVLALRVPQLDLAAQERVVARLESARLRSEHLRAELRHLESDLDALLPSALAQVFGA